MSRVQSSTVGPAPRTRHGGATRNRHLGRRAREAEFGSLVVPLFVIALAVPIEIQLGPLRLWPYRILLLLAFLPCLFVWLSGRAGKIRWPDLLVVFSGVWGVLSVTVNQGAAAWQGSGILVLETIGSYFLARTMIRSADSFERMVKWFFWVIAFLLPFAVIEALTARPVLLDLLGTVFTVFGNTPHEVRLGLDRVQGTFQHPILFGVFCVSGFSLALYVLGFGKGGINRWFRPFLICVAVFLSLSSGPLSALLAQWGLIVWHRLTRALRSRWLLLGSVCLLAYVLIDVMSNRAPIEVFISYFSLNPGTAWARIHIFRHARAQVMMQPLLGIGLSGDWSRASWMSGSADMFWMVVAMRYGLPGVLSLGLAVILTAISLGRCQGLSERVAAYRTGFLFTLVGMTIAGWGVHFWNAPYALFMFLVGSGLWMLDSGQGISSHISAINGPAHASPKQPVRLSSGTNCRAIREVR